MESIKNSQKSTGKTLQKDPPYFGLYLNMALLNLRKVENHIRKWLGDVALLSDKSDFHSLLTTDNLSSAKWTRFYYKSRKFLPFLEMFDSDKKSYENRRKTAECLDTIDRQKISSLLKEVYGKLQEIRNAFSHYHIDDQSVKHTALIISSEMHRFIKNAYSFALQKTRARFTGVFVETDFLQAEEKGDYKKFFAIGGNEGIKLKDNALIFFICLFLDREEAFKFLGRATGFKSTKEKGFLAVRETFCALCYRQPHERLLSGNPREALLMDMLNELNRCPGILFEMLDEKDQKSFLPLLGEEEQAHILENSLNDELCEAIDDPFEMIASLSKRARYKDRFPYLMLRYIEEKNLLPFIRFRIDLGCLELASYPKKMGEENNYERSVTDHAMAFGRLTDFHNEDEVLQQITKGITDEVRFSLYAPRYAIYNNKIGFVWTSRSKKKSFPTLKKKEGEGHRVAYTLQNEESFGFISIYDLRKILLLSFLDEGKNIVSGLFKQSKANWENLSENLFDAIRTELQKEFPVPLIRYTLPRSKGGKFVDPKLADKQEKYESEFERRKEKLSEILSEKGFDLSQIPRRMIDEWLNVLPTSKEKKLKGYVETLKLDCRERLRVFEKREKGEHPVPPRIGEMATDLAKDIIRMVIDQGMKQRITSAYYSEIQRCLAQYAGDDNRRHLDSIIRELGLKDRKKGHPFLGKVLRPDLDHTEKLYQRYFKEKKEWLEATFYPAANPKRVPRFVNPPAEKQKELPLIIHNLMKERPEWRDWKQRKNSHPIDLPSQLFENEICRLLKDKIGKESSGKLKWNEMFKLYWDKEFPNGMQRFYRCKRRVEVFDKVVEYEYSEEGGNYKKYYEALINEVVRQKISSSKENSKLQVEDLTLSVRRAFKRAINEKEYQLRLVCEDDRLLFMAVRDLYDWKEVQLDLNKIDNMLGEPVSVSQVIQLENGQPDAVIKAECKLKDVSKLMRYCYDGRVKGLMPYFANHEATQEQVEVELRHYEDHRRRVFDWVFALEKSVLKNEKLRRLYEKSQEGCEHRRCIDALRKATLVSEEEYKFLVHIRNKSAHNQFPDLEFGKLTPNVTSGFCECIWSKYKAIICRIIPFIDPERRFFGKLLEQK
ncbi:hypothetical protein IX307_000809 [Bacteroides pyogenes]|uniref:type VI-B CRISPR-associated RNA-guided ribonuclease Cas13b n=2 Tax=Bacteroides pyogenes TaxID=310300 RepID=UPI001652E061|nr:type VI-B CRISPR-associated RNA-guided ribonuclease Cas13b [Bacteroides pyogenes]MBR8708246.1 hypothetical protein [Bacteroides pyogenes]MBR8718336.1 hypothetical protein [Bacteroides pyogenes]MBR8719472.1 hypothetical protein [Bacteroides pyogenes]MBR8725702.1 hypothetical protein [Bacteroides pyogenes]MBR8738946.1 hypothetical protein [Bacteroides pyogenes]